MKVNLFLGPKSNVDHEVMKMHLCSPNNLGQMSVRPQKVFPIPMKFGVQVEVDE